MTASGVQTIAAREMPEGLDLTAVLAVGFGTSVAMWALGYVARLPALLLPAPLLLLLLLGCLFGGGLVLGRVACAGWTAGALSGLVAGLLNLLVLGSLLTGDDPNRIVPSALWWVPGSILVSAMLVAAGALAGTSRRPTARRRDWAHVFVWVAVAATSLLLAVGGVVTSAEAGLAVDDWPTSFGYNMFLYPLSKMTGGIYYEHAHRLIGALVGLTTLVLALVLQRTERPAWVRRLAWVAVALVVLQGILGGLRVTGRSLALAMVHGVLGQMFFGTLVALTAFTSAGWRSAAPPLRRAGVATDRALGIVLLAVLVGQLLLGAAQRHFQVLLIVHIVTGVAIVAPLALHVGIRAWGLNADTPLLRRLGLALVGTLLVQVVLGLGAYVVTGAGAAGSLSRGYELTVATAHQWFGAVVLGTAVLLVCWSYRAVAPEGGPRP